MSKIMKSFTRTFWVAGRDVTVEVDSKWETYVYGSDRDGNRGRNKTELLEYTFDTPKVFNDGTKFSFDDREDLDNDLFELLSGSQPEDL